MSSTRKKTLERVLETRGLRGHLLSYVDMAAAALDLPCCSRHLCDLLRDWLRDGARHLDFMDTPEADDARDSYTAIARHAVALRKLAPLCRSVRQFAIGHWPRGDTRCAEELLRANTAHLSALQSCDVGGLPTTTVLRLARACPELRQLAFRLHVEGLWPWSHQRTVPGVSHFLDVLFAGRPELTDVELHGWAGTEREPPAEPLTVPWPPNLVRLALHCDYGRGLELLGPALKDLQHLRVLHVSLHAQNDVRDVVVHLERWSARAQLEELEFHLSTAWCWRNRDAAAPGPAPATCVPAIAARDRIQSAVGRLGAATLPATVVFSPTEPYTPDSLLFRRYVPDSLIYDTYDPLDVACMLRRDDDALLLAGLRHLGLRRVGASKHYCEMAEDPFQYQGLRLPRLRTARIDCSPTLASLGLWTAAASASAMADDSATTATTDSPPGATLGTLHVARLRGLQELRDLGRQCGASLRDLEVGVAAIATADIVSLLAVCPVLCRLSVVVLAPLPGHVSPVPALTKQPAAPPSSPRPANQSTAVAPTPLVCAKLWYLKLSVYGRELFEAVRLPGLCELVLLPAADSCAPLPALERCCPALQELTVAAVEGRRRALRGLPELRRLVWYTRNVDAPTLLRHWLPLLPQLVRMQLRDSGPHQLPPLLRALQHHAGRALRHVDLCPNATTQPLPLTELQSLCKARPQLASLNLPLSAAATVHKFLAHDKMRRATRLTIDSLDPLAHALTTMPGAL